MNKMEYASSTHDADGGVIKIMACERTLTWLSPSENETFHLTPDGTLPDIVFAFHSDSTGDYHWSWAIEWHARTSGLRERARQGETLKVFCESGAFISRDKSWLIDFAGKVLGGTLTVTVKVGAQALTRTVVINGRNPSRDSVAAYVASLDNMTGLDKLLEQETRTRHFIEHDGEPIVSFDQGFGMTQMTHPAPSYEQAWNWKANILGGSSIYSDKLRMAKQYLGQAGRSYTQDQLHHETLSRWNGGAYHQWDSASVAWIRRKHILCDSSTGNIGWPMDNEKNQGKGEPELHRRDKDTYNKGTQGQSADHPWEYKGVCYADHVLGQ
jgi:hypothetical protein